VIPEPDLEPLDVDEAARERIHAALPELPAARAARFREAYGLPVYDAGVLTATRPLADYYEAVVERVDEPKEVSNWVMGEVLRLANERGVEVRPGPEPRPVAPEDLAALLALKADGTVSGSAAREVLDVMAESGRSPAEIVEERGLEQVSDETALAVEVDAVIAAHPGEVETYRGGKKGLLGFFVGQVMRRTGGSADPQLVNRLLRERLEG